MTDEEMMKILNNNKCCDLREYNTCIECEEKKNIAVQQLINLYKKKSKMVDLMAEHLTTPVHDKNWVIKYFEDEVELDEEV